MSIRIPRASQADPAGQGPPVPPEEAPGSPEEELEVIQPSLGFARETWLRFRRSRLALVGLSLVILLVITAVLAPLIAPYDPYDVDLNLQFLPPGGQHLAGTDMYGRDVFTRLLYGARISLVIGLVPTLLSMTVGSILGVTAGYFGGKTDRVIMSLADIVLAFPSLLLAMVIMYTLGASLYNLFIALSAVGWAGTARVVRSQTLSLKRREFVDAARAIGVKPMVIMFRHILPNCLPQLLVLLTLGIPGAVMSEAGLSFLGVGAQPPTASWGLEIARSKQYIMSAPWCSVVPGIGIFVTVLGFNFLGDGLRDALDPYMKR